MGEERAMSVELNGIAHIQLTVIDPARVSFWEKLCHFLQMKTLIKGDGIVYCIGSRTGILVRADEDARSRGPFDQRRRRPDSSDVSRRRARMTRGGPLDCLLGTMTLGSLLLAALSFGAEVFPERLCENLPEARPEVKAWVVQAAPELAPLPVRELAEKAALETIGRASMAGWGNIDFFTHAVFREPCAFYLSRETLRSIDAAFDLALLTPVRGKDKTGQDFEMTAVLAGRGRLLLLYDRDGIVYRNQRENRDFKLGSRVEFHTPAAGVLQNVRGLRARILLLGWVTIRSIVKEGETLEVRAGTFTSESPLRPIDARHGPTTSAR
jgi:hypothetical protein